MAPWLLASGGREHEGGKGEEEEECIKFHFRYRVSGPTAAGEERPTTKEKIERAYVCAQ